MRRRNFIVGLACTTAAWPLAIRAQPANSPVIGYFSSRSSDAEKPMREAFLRGLEESGYVNGRDVRIEYRYANGQEDELPAIASDLVRHQVAMLVATDGPAAVAAKGASTTIPTVFSAGGDPVKLGLVASLNRPGGNATGVFVFVTELGPKRLQLLREVVPHAKTIAYVVNLNSGSGPAQTQAIKASAATLGQQIIVVSASTEDQINDAFATIAERKADAIVYSASPFFQVMRERLVALAARYSIPAVYEWPVFVKSGGLMSYSSSPSEVGAQIGNYAGRILKGARPSDLPVVQAVKFDLVINLKTAKSLGLTIPPTLLATADEVIE
jgi:putative ABC transport system substrate-binding protein